MVAVVHEAFLLSATTYYTDDSLFRQLLSTVFPGRLKAVLSFSDQYTCCDTYRTYHGLGLFALLLISPCPAKRNVLYSLGPLLNL